MEDELCLTYKKYNYLKYTKPANFRRIIFLRLAYCLGEADTT
jgi:hypothetical protein